ncbi:GNAT superfamily N-acetyltransferase [Friedmanniella endophytica]|uniref:GNAT superfamily N-acetyltransferase n=1 Tax=Microlunatus kandeliicorticis TaxID=1759536 RepID=A0A7W3IRP9_9ACTN|nr:hypothetical protein [Microlunatus kandeliicorticis]MBA8794044.1 GNAT superfamily N-acetyltransferase [Microlunatus kandeliicorticis]
MSSEGIVLEMTTPSQLQPSPRLKQLEILAAPDPAAAALRRLYRIIWEPLGGGGRSRWTEQQWADELSEPGMKAFIGRMGRADVAMAEVGWSGRGDAAFVVIGVVPTMQGVGIGGDFLTRLTQLMWSTPAPNGQLTERVWLWTRPDEHPHTVPNYLARGFVYGPDLRP